MAVTGASVAASAADAAVKVQQEEEEEMTPYSAKDLADSWEFKILRITTGRFSDPLWLKGILNRKSRAGWELVDKFDNFRLRLKRPISARARDASLGFDPYRTWAGTSQTRMTVYVLAGVLLAIAAIVGAIGVMVAYFGSH